MFIAVSSTHLLLLKYQRWIQNAYVQFLEKMTPVIHVFKLDIYLISERMNFA